MQQRLVIIEQIFNEGARHSLPARLSQLQARYRASAQWDADMHSLEGLCATFGLFEMGDELKAFREAPSETGIATLWTTLYATRQRMQSAIGSPVASSGSSVSSAGASSVSSSAASPGGRSPGIDNPNLASTNQSPQSGLFQLGTPAAGVSRLFRTPGPSPVVGARASPLGISTFFATRMPPQAVTAAAFATTSVAAAIPTAAVAAAVVAAAATAEPLVCVGIDDDPFIHKAHASVFRQLGATASRSLGETRKEQLACADVALGLLDLHTLQPTPGGRPADVLLIDQRIYLDGQPHMLGTEVAEELHRRGFGGVVGIISGADKTQLAELRALPGIDLTACKSDLLSGRVTAKIRDALAAKRAALFTNTQKEGRGEGRGGGGERAS
jgi:hypothetical protein